MLGRGKGRLARRAEGLTSLRQEGGGAVHPRVGRTGGFPSPGTRGVQKKGSRAGIPGTVAPLSGYRMSIASPKLKKR